MWWVAPLAGAAIGAYLGRQQQKAQEDARKDQALINMYAPLFGQAPKALGVNQDKVTPAVIQGGLSGYQMQANMALNDKLEKLYDKENKAPVFIPYQSYQALDAAPRQQQIMGYTSNPYQTMYG